MARQPPTPDTRLQPFKFGKLLPQGALVHAKQLGENHQRVRLVNRAAAFTARESAKEQSEHWQIRVPQLWWAGYY
jgi:hypothetical protein